MASVLVIFIGLAGSVLAQGVSIFFNVPTPTFVSPPPPASSSPSTPLVMGYYPDWAPASFPPSKVNFEKVDVVDLGLQSQIKPSISPGMMQKLLPPF